MVLLIQTVLLPEMVQLMIVIAPWLEMPPPESLLTDPPEIVRPEIVAVTLAKAKGISKMRKDPAPRTANRFAPGPLIVRLLSITNSPLTTLIVVIPIAKLIVSPPESEALRIACRSVPGPLSLPLVTVRVAA